MPWRPRILLLSTALLLLSMTAVVIHVIRQIPGELPASPSPLPSPGGKLEAGALVDAQELHSFLIFAGKEGEKMPKRRKKIELSQERILPSLLPNHCAIIYCYQHRMAFDDIPSVFWRGLLGIEDYRFLEHQGIDPRSILRALLTNIKRGKAVQGGSTLTQQLAKNLYYSGDKSLWRKIKEAIASVYLELKYPKEKILEAYFNEVVWGSLQGIRLKGLYAAALFYFAKHPEDIGAYEAAILVSLLKGPAHYHPLRQTERLIERTEMVFHQLQKLDLFPQGEATAWTRQNWNTWITSLQRQERLLHGQALWRVLQNSSNYLGKYEQFVFTVKALQIQKNAEERYPEADISVKSVIGNLEDDKTFTYYSKYERDKSAALSLERHQVGSVIKPLLYGVFSEFGINLQDEISLAPLTLRLKSGPWSPREVAKDLPERASLRTSLRLSYNRPVIRLAQKIGFDTLEDALKEHFPRLKRPLREYPAQLLGAMELGLMELFALYRRFILRECGEQSTGRPPEQNIVLALSDPKSTTVHKTLRDTIGRHKFFGKTGTSNNGLDNWYVFFDGTMLGVIHLGHEGTRQDTRFALYGSGTAFRIFQGFIRDRGYRFNELSCP